MTRKPEITVLRLDRSGIRKALGDLEAETMELVWARALRLHDRLVACREQTDPQHDRRPRHRHDGSHARRRLAPAGPRPRLPPAPRRPAQRGFGATLLGGAFAFAWIPCIGPILASILLYAGSAGTAAAGALLLLVYALGLGVPFILTGLAFTRAVKALRWVRRFTRPIEVFSGVALTTVGSSCWPTRCST
jgi:cytochrome c biogenesis protein CcdA